MKILYTFCILTITVSILNGQDLIRNGGFENLNNFEYWDSTVTVTGASVQPTDITSRSGSWSVEINTGISPIGGWTQLSQDLLTPANNINYRLTIWIKDSVASSNFVGVYGITGSGEVALGVDSLNNTTIIDPDSGRITITQNFFQNWGRIFYYFNSGENYTGYILKFQEATDGNSLKVHLDDLGILPVPGQSIVQVTSPNGGESWIAGDQENITWTSSNVTNVKIDYSTDSGNLWLSVVASIPAVNGSYEWTIPNTPSSQCLVRVSDAALASRFDISDGVFTIVPVVTLTAPNGSENWLVSSQHNITWNSQIITDVSIEYSTDNGGSWISIISSTPAAGGSYNWLVPNTPSTECLVRISDAANALINDVSDGIFTIVPVITVNSPNGGESWVGNSNHIITWSSQIITDVSIEYSTDNGVSWINIISSTPASNSNYTWTVPNTPSSQCLVRISDASNSAIDDVSDATFTITPAPISTVTLTAPNGGEIWEEGTSHSITWTRQAVAQVKIEYSTDNGGGWTVVVPLVPAVSGNYNWTIPNTPSTQCLIRISDTSDPSVNDVSDSTFTIESSVSVDDLKSGIPDKYELFNNYPNPFNPSTTIRFSIPEAADVSLNIYNTLGQKIAQPVKSKLEAGRYSYQWDAGSIATGIYIYELRTNNFVSLKKMILLK